MGRKKGRRQCNAVLTAPLPPQIYQPPSWLGAGAGCGQVDHVSRAPPSLPSLPILFLAFLFPACLPFFIYLFICRIIIIYPPLSLSLPRSSTASSFFLLTNKQNFVSYVTKISSVLPLVSFGPSRLSLLLATHGKSTPTQLGSDLTDFVACRLVFRLHPCYAMLCFPCPLVGGSSS